MLKSYFGGWVEEAGSHIIQALESSSSHPASASQMAGTASAHCSPRLDHRVVAGAAGAVQQHSKMPETERDEEEPLTHSTAADGRPPLW